MKEDPRSDISRLDEDREDRSFFQDTVKPLARVLWSYRRVMAVAAALALILSAFVGAWIFMGQPVERSASVPFRLLFEGAEEGRYPSEMSFSSSDIVATPVLDVVFENNDLERYTSNAAFANSLFVLEAGRDAELLALEYTSKLADPRLTTVDRAGLEREFKEKLDSVRLEYTLTLMSPSEGWQMPQVLMQKVLSDVLGTWATHAAERRGAMEYQKPLITTRLPIADERTTIPLVPRADALRVQLRRLARNIQELQLLPGGNVVRGGPNNVSLPELRAHLEDVIAYQVQPLFRTIVQRGMTTDRAATLSYLEEQALRTARDVEETTGRQQAIVSSLLTYVTERSTAASGSSQGQTSGATTPGMSMAMPQLSDSFIDRLMTMGSREDDLKFRQAMVRDASRAGMEAVEARKERSFYQSMLASVRTSTAGAALPDKAREDVSSSLSALETSAARISQEANELYSTLSRNNLNPRANLYAVSGPFTIRTHRPLPLQRVLVYCLLAVLATVFVAAVGSLAHSYSRVKPVAGAAAAVDPYDAPSGDAVPHRGEVVGSSGQ